MAQWVMSDSMMALRTAGVAAAMALVLSAAEGTPRTTAPAAPVGQAVRKSPRGFNRAAIITIEGEINDVTSKSVARRIKRAQDQDIRLIVLELNTPGGQVSSALDICNKIKTLPPEIHTVAWVKPHAFSAGAMIALACADIVVAPYSQIGDCQPIMIGPEGPQAIPEGLQAKASGPVLTEFRDSARKRGYSELLCDAMILPEFEVFWIQNSKTGERLFVDRAQRDWRFDIEPTRAADSPVVTRRKVEEVRKDDRETGGRSGARFETVKSRSEWEYVRHAGDFIVDRQPIISMGELLTMTQDEAIAYGFARTKVATDQQLIDLYDISGPIERMDLNWSEELVDWLTNPIVRGILMVLVVLGAYAEFHAPGTLLPGVVALIALVIFLGAPYLTGLANAWEIILVLLGLALLALEIFVIPGFGIAGIAGVVLIFVGLVSTFVPDMGNPFSLPRFGRATLWEGLGTGLKVMASAVAASIAGAVVLSRFFPKVPYVGRIVAENPRPEQVVMPDPYPHVAFLGDLGRTEGTLRPAGKARFGDTLVDVVSQSEFIGPGEPVEVIEREGGRVVVRRVRGSGPGHSS
jgi:membrane-bound serine protease (ClpP class)